MLDENNETSFTDDSCESKTKKESIPVKSIGKNKSLRIKNKQLQNEVVKALKHKRSITLENNNSVVIKYLIKMNETMNYLFLLLYCKSTVSEMENLDKMVDSCQNIKCNTLTSVLQN